MNHQVLEFEQPIEELKQKIHALRMVSNDNEVNINDEINRLEVKCKELTENIFASLDPWQITQMARHPQRPQTTDYLENIFTDFQELHGDRHYSSAPAIIGGLARLDGMAVIILGNQKGKRTKEKVYRNFGMARPEEYHKALRLMKMAEKFNLPLLTFIDTAGAYPGIGAEERNQSEAIASNLFTMATLKTPIICTITGEAGSGGALAIGVGDQILMLEYAIYSVISPEGCASILWKDPSQANVAARAMGITANNILSMGLIDSIIKEPLGGAHRNVVEMGCSLKNTLISKLQMLKSIPINELIEQRYNKFMAMGEVG